MRVCKHGCDITRIFIGYLLSDARFDFLVGNMSVYQENLFQSRGRRTRVCLHLSNYFGEIFLKAKEDIFFVFT